MAARLIYDQIDTPHADMCFSIIVITHSISVMDHKDYFKDLFKSIPNYRKIVLLMFLIGNDLDFLTECRFFKSDINRFCIEFENFLIKQSEDFLKSIKNEEESIIERILFK